ncbi:MAG: hypothetical protein AAGD13_00815 [Pseudomonadota bacterium]
MITFTNENGDEEKIKIQDSGSLSQADLTAADFNFTVSSAAIPPAPTNTVFDTQARFSQLIGTDSTSDAFVFLEDSRVDAIRGFVDGEDVIDLTSTAGLTFDDLNIRAGNDKIVITYTNSLGAEEKIKIRDSGDLAVSDLTADDFLFA